MSSGHYEDMDKTQRIALNQELITLTAQRRALNTKRGPLGHGVRVHVDADGKRARIDARCAEIRAALAE